MSENNLNNRFEFAEMQDEIKDVKFEGEAIGFFKDAWLRLCKNKPSIKATITILIIILFSFVGPLISPYGWDDQDLNRALLPSRIPGLEKIGICTGAKETNARKSNLSKDYKDCVISIEKEYKIRKEDMVTIKYDAYKKAGVKDKYFWFGTDSLGRSQWTRLWKGTRVSLLIGVLSCAVNIFIGLIYGSVSGYYGGMVDMIMQRIIEILVSIPMFIVTILFIMYVGTGLIAIAMSIVVTGWIGTSIIIRSQFYRYKGQEYVLASRTMGAPDRKLIFRHILPNAIGPVITSASVAIPGAILAESGLAYLGLGLQAPKPSIGVLLAEGQKVLLINPHLTVFPAILISILIISFNLLGNGLRDAFNPTLRGVE